MAYTVTEGFRHRKDAPFNEPIEFYDIYLGSQTAVDSETLHFVNYYERLDYFDPDGNAKEYLPLAISRTQIGRSASTQIDSLSVRIDNVNRGMSAYAADHDFNDKRIVIRVTFRDVLSEAGHDKILFDGKIRSIAFPPKKMIAHITSHLGSLSIETGRPFQLECNLQLGDAYCLVDRTTAANKQTGEATGGSTTTIVDTTRNEDDDYWNFGYIEFDPGGPLGGQKRIVVDFDKATHTIYLDYALSTAVIAGTHYTIYRGCDKTLAMCQDSFSNDANFLGFHTIPLRKT